MPSFSPPNSPIPSPNHQIDYILGRNPLRLSYMVGFSANYPKQVHHRGASVVSINVNRTQVDCGGGFFWAQRNAPDPNVHVGAIVGGPMDGVRGEKREGGRRGKKGE